MRRVSLNARRAQDAHTTDEVEIALFFIDHPALDVPVRLSTDPTERISEEPLVYGTRSTWHGTNARTDPFLFAGMSAELPGDQEDAPAAATLVLDVLDAALAEQLRAFTERPTVDMAVVLASSPSLVEVEYRGLKIMGVDGTAEEIALQISRAPIEDEGVPMDRFTKAQFPGLFR